MFESAETSNKLTVYVSLAMNQVRFFYALGRNQESDCVRVAHICFHEGGVKWLAEQGELVFNPFAYDAEPPPFATYGIDNPLSLIVHEQAAYELQNGKVLLHKFRRHLGAAVQIFDEIIKNHSGQVRVVQELGGFLSVLAVFYETQRRGIDNYFLEPSFFRRRFFLVKNSLAALQLSGPRAEVASPEVIDYVEETLKNQALVIPLKDRSHYRRPMRKLVDAQNWKRLIQKIADKYLHGRQEEFSYISGHVSRNVRMFWNHSCLRAHYRQIPKQQKFIYYPLHVPADVALTLRSPAYLDQIALIDELSQLVPHDWIVVFKEHPALVGGTSASMIARMLEKRTNVILLDPGINNFEVLQEAELIVTVNSKAGAEALIFEKPVVVLGDAFYRNSSLVIHVEQLKTLRRLIATGNYRQRFTKKDALRYFEDIWQASLPGEIYDLDPANITQFTNSLNASMGFE